MRKNELMEEIEAARKDQVAKNYTDGDAEKLRQKAAKVFEHYEADMLKKMSEQGRNCVYEYYSHS